MTDIITAEALQNDFGYVPDCVFTTSPMGQSGTDNTTALNNAIASLTNGGTVRLPSGYGLVTSVNLTGTNSVTLEGPCVPVNASDKAAVLVPINNNNPTVDLTGSGGIKLSHIQVGTQRSPVLGLCGIMLAQIKGQGGGTLHTLDHVMVNGSWSGPCVYDYGVGNWSMSNTRLWNRLSYGDSSTRGGSFGALVCTKDNFIGLSSAYQTIETASVGAGGLLATNCEFHEFQRPGANSSGTAILLRGASQVTVIGSIIENPATGGNLYCKKSTDGTPCQQVTIEASNFYSENNVLPTHNIYVEGAGALNTTQLLNNTYANSGGIRGGQAASYTGFATP